MITLKSYLAGKWQAGAGEGSTLLDPTTEEPLARVSSEGLDFAAAVAYGRDVGGPALRAMSFVERAAMLGKLAGALREAREMLLDESIKSGGTTRSDAKFDVDGATGTIAYYADLGSKLGDRGFFVEGADGEQGEKLARSPRFCGYHVRVPLRGVAVHVNAFNFPAWGMAEKAAVALLAGVPVISKPATSTAALAFRLMEVLVASGALPDGAWQLVCGSAGDLLTHLGGQDVLAFTGSAATARALRALPNVIEHSVRVNVEADSLNAAVLAPDVDDDTYQMFLRDVVKEVTQKTGQKCTATRRVLVPADDLDRVEQDLAERLQRIVVGDPSDSDVRMGPLVNRAQLAEARAGVDKLVSAGARVVYGDPNQVEARGRSGDQGYFFGPVLLRADAPDEAIAVHAHEVFGPVATLMPYEGAEQAAKLVAMGGGGLVASVYSDDAELTKALTLELAPYHGRVFVGSKKVADVATPPGMVLPSCVHGGPGRAGGGEELGGTRGLDLYLQRSALQGDRAVLERALGLR
ncbi:MAG: 3,4-dehydroadipyl-CoA semialdehyde dehydrogenase [Myxococcales bacterium]|nr:3,4-dehydroadipyl-CoA semialdehyde dehydrogenase [Myxococcales bacterium]